MQWTGLPFETAALLAGAAALVITALYLVKLKKRRVEVPFSGLWTQLIRTQHQRAQSWRRFKRTFSWFFHLLIAALLTLSMLGPHFDDEVLEERHLLILLDDSASMAATDVSGGHNRFDIARRHARDILETVGGNDRVMIALFNNHVQPLGPFVDDTSLLDASLSDRHVTANPADLNQALSFAADSLRDRGPSELVIISDAAGIDPEELPPIDFDEHTTIRHIKVGESSQNLAITSFSARRYPSNRLDHELYIEITSYFDRPVEATLELRANDRLIDRHPLSLEPGDLFRQFYPGQATAGQRLEARIRITDPDVRDVFPLDDTAFAVVPANRRLRVQLISDGNLFLEGPLLLSPHIDLHLIPPHDYDPSLDFDATIFDRIAPPPPTNGDILYVDPPADSSPFPIRDIQRDPIITDTRQTHPLLRWITLKDLNIASSSTFTLSTHDTAIASAFGHPIIVAREDEERRTVAIGFDLRNSDFPLRVGYPVFLLNVMDYFAREDADMIYSFPTGETWSIPVDRSVRTAQITAPDATSHPVAIHDGFALFYGDQPGFYQLHTEHDRIPLAANLFSPRDSDITPVSLSWEGHTISHDVDDLFFERRQLWIYLLLAALVLLLAEWLSFNRRWTE